MRSTRHWKYQSASYPQRIRLEFFAATAQGCMGIGKALNKKSVPQKWGYHNRFHAQRSPTLLSYINTFKAHLRTRGEIFFLSKAFHWVIMSGTPLFFFAFLSVFVEVKNISQLCLQIISLNLMKLTWYAVDQTKTIIDFNNILCII